VRYGPADSVRCVRADNLHSLKADVYDKAKWGFHAVCVRPQYLSYLLPSHYHNLTTVCSFTSTTGNPAAAWYQLPVIIQLIWTIWEATHTNTSYRRGFDSKTHSSNYTYRIIWCFSDRASWIDYILITNLMHWLLFIHKILFSSTCFEHQVLIFRRIQL